MGFLRHLPCLLFVVSAFLASWAAMNREGPMLQAGWFGLVVASALMIAEGVTRSEEPVPMET